MAERTSTQRTLLLVDDEPRILSALRRCLRREGWAIQLADSPAAALELCAREPVDFVLSDQKMPGMSGLELLEEVARRWPATGRALLTGWPEEVPSSRARDLGLAAVLSKPWDDGDLKRLLHAFLD